MKKEDVSFFDRGADWSVVERRLPHWSQGGTLCFVTWRLADSLPAEVLRRLDADIESFLVAEGLIERGGGSEKVVGRKGESVSRENVSERRCYDWKVRLMERNEACRARVHWKLFHTRDKYLDAGYGNCLLRKPQHAQQVIDSLRTFDEQRYFLTDLVVMPNHCHFICAFGDEDAMLAQCTSWKRFIARRINAAEGLKGEMWQVDQFDHLIRNEEYFDHFREYIRDNPNKAGLSPGEYALFQKDLGANS